MENKEERIVEETVDSGETTELKPKVDDEVKVAPEEQQEEVVNESEVKEGEPEEVPEEPKKPEVEPEREEKPEQEPKEETPSATGDNDNKENETDGEKPDKAAESEVKEEEAVPTPTQEELMTQLEELRAEKEEQEALRACNEQVMKVEQEFQVCSDKIAQALKESFAQNGIDASKTIEELKAEDPAKATLAMQFISQAQDLKTQLEQAAIKEISKHQNEVIYRAASREFEKMGLNLEQAKDAVATFKRIVNEIGVTDLDEDLKMKVQLAAGRAKIMVPAVEDVDENVPSDTPAPSDTTALNEPSPEIEEGVKEKPEEVEKEIPPVEENVEEAKPEPIVEKPKVEDFEEGVAGQASVGAGTIITELNVLEELNKLPFKERTKFYKEHEDVITKAMLKRK